MDVSVIIPFYKADATIKDAIESVQMQTVIAQRNDFKLEIVVINDDPTPGGCPVLASLCERDLRIKVYQNSGVHGASAARNCGVSVATGQLLAFLDADDVWLPFHLEKHLRLHDIYRPALTSSEYSETDRMLHIINEAVMQSMDHRRNSALRESFENKVDYYCEDARELFLKCCPALTSAVVVRREALIAVGGFSLTLQTAEDVHAWTLLAGLRQGFAFCPVATMLYRQVQSSLSKSRMSCRWRDLADQYWRLSYCGSYSEFSREIRDNVFSYYMIYLSSLRSESKYDEAFAVLFHVVTRFGISKALCREALRIVARRR